VTIDLGYLKDPSGNALTASDARASVIADPGLLAGKAGGEQIEIFDAAFDIADQLQPCTTCLEHSHLAGPLRHTFDITPLRGQRVFLIVELAEDFFIAPNHYALLLDDIQIR